MTEIAIKSSESFCEQSTRKYPQGRKGTYAGYTSHVRNGESACEECKQARREYIQERRENLQGEKLEKHLRLSKAASQRWREKHPDRDKESHRLMRKKRQAFLREIKEASPCSECGKYYPFYVMEFDHITGEKVSKISTWGVNRGQQVVLDEIDKCELVCSNCHMNRTFDRAGVERAYARPRTWRNREVMRKAKGKPCSDCGVNYLPHLLEFDHVRGEKKFDIGRLGSNSRTEDLLDEIEKCDVVCGNCHAERTYQRMVNSEEVA